MTLWPSTKTRTLMTPPPRVQLSCRDSDHTVFFTPHEAHGKGDNSSNNNSCVYCVPAVCQALGCALCKFLFNSHSNCIISIHFEECRGLESHVAPKVMWLPSPHFLPSSSPASSSGPWPFQRWQKNLPGTGYSSVVWIYRHHSQSLGIPWGLAVSL